MIRNTHAVSPGGVLSAYSWSDEPTEEPTLIYERVTREAVTAYASFTPS